MEDLVAKLRRDYAGSLSFRKGELASWSPHRQQISYSLTDDETGAWSLLHEVGHALLGHQSYQSDMELLKKEVEAWEKARELAEAYSLTISNEHIQDCLDTYRDWIYKRSTCPACQNHGLQQNKDLYSCVNCQNSWMVTSARFCRPYRLKKAQAV